MMMMMKKKHLIGDELDRKHLHQRVKAWRLAKWFVNDKGEDGADKFWIVIGQRLSLSGCGNYDNIVGHVLLQYET